MRRACRCFLLTAAFLLASAGCGNRPKLVGVTGKLTHKGQALTAGSIYFHPAEGNAYQGEKPSSLLQLDGSFTMRTYPHGEGVPPGKYKVTLAPELAGRVGRPDYGKADRTPLSIDVPDAGVKDQLFEVK
jgi:hypothetical protein